MLKPIRIGLIVPRHLPDEVVNKLKRNIKKRVAASLSPEVLRERRVIVGHKVEISMSIPREMKLSEEQIGKLRADLHNEVLSILPQAMADDTIVTEDWTIVDEN